MAEPIEISDERINGNTVNLHVTFVRE
jgi:hypothetical protein